MDTQGTNEDEERTAKLRRVVPFIFTLYRTFHSLHNIILCHVLKMLTSFLVGDNIAIFVFLIIHLGIKPNKCFVLVLCYFKGPTEGH